MLRNSLLFLLVALASYALNQPQPTTETITVCGGLGLYTQGALRAAGVSIQEEGGLWTLEVADPRVAVKALCTVRETLFVGKSVVENNIANAKTTMTAEGTPYRRQFLQVSVAGEVLGVAEEPGDFNWIYDPSHPEAMRDGPKHGYRAMPNINLIAEQTDMRRYDSEQKSIEMLLERLDPELVLSPFGSGGRPPLPAGHEDTSNLTAMEKLEVLAIPRLDFPPAPVEGKDPVAFKPAWVACSSDPVQVGQASVACSLNWLFQEPRFQAEDIDEKYGFGLLAALRGESLELGVGWRDAGNLSAELWPSIEEHLAARQPVILALGDSALGRIVMLTKVEGDQVTYLDTMTSRECRTDKTTLLAAPQHSDGNFVFLTGAGVSMAPGGDEAFLDF